ncbi:MAG: hypothetical protein LC637_10845, partial [Xanthomonadaceae bacterium]|nr:hypothetical protein [Xanthomonadaceae bacterium]
MGNMKIGKFSGETRGKTEAGRRRIVIRNVRPGEVALVEDEAKNLPNYVSHRTIRRADGSGNYDVFIYLSV